MALRQGVVRFAGVVCFARIVVADVVETFLPSVLLHSATVPLELVFRSQGVYR